MKAIRRIAVLIAGIFLISSCSILGRLTGNATTTGTNTGSALLNLYQLYQAFRAGGRTPSVSNNYGIDLSKDRSSQAPARFRTQRRATPTSSPTR